MKCPKCGNEDNFIEFRLDIVSYDWYKGDDKELHLEETIPNQTLLSLSIICGECNHSGTLTEFGEDRRDMLNPLEEDSTGIFIRHTIEEGMIKIYPSKSLLEDIQEQLKLNASQHSNKEKGGK